MAEHEPLLPVNREEELPDASQDWVFVKREEFRKLVSAMEGQAKLTIEIHFTQLDSLLRSLEFEMKNKPRQSLYPRPGNSRLHKMEIDGPMQLRRLADVLTWKMKALTDQDQNEAKPVTIQQGLELTTWFEGEIAKNRKSYDKLVQQDWKEEMTVVKIMIKFMALFYKFAKIFLKK
jgi:hypothetical protein